MPFPRATGILLHPTSLPACGGIGDFGPAAYQFVGKHVTAANYQSSFSKWIWLLSAMYLMSAISDGLPHVRMTVRPASRARCQ